MNHDVLQQLTQQADSPFFVYDLEGLRNHLNVLASAEIRPWYACKANPLGAVLDVFNEAGFGFDCASEGELKHVLSRGVDGKRILLTGPGKTPRFLKHALQAGVETFVVESERQLRLLDQLAGETHTMPRVLLRLQLDWSGDGSNLLGGDGVSAFGLEPDAWESLALNELRAVQPIGFHVFQWGNVLCAERLSAVWRRIGREASELAQRLGLDFQVLDLGGGLGIPYEGEDELDWPHLARQLSALRQAGGWKETWLEPGRYAVGPFGRYLARVADHKQVRGENLLILEGGINHLLRPALTGQGFPCRPLQAVDGRTEVFRLHGPLCTALDNLGEVQLHSSVQPGEWLVFDQCGAYGFTESMPYFLCHDLPGEAVWQNGAARWERKPEPASGWLR